MKKELTYRPYLAGLLAFLLLFSFSLKEIHHLFGHNHEEHEHEPSHKCEAKGNDVHIHDDSYHFHQCYLCHFSFSELTIDDFAFELHIDELPVTKSPTPSSTIYSPLTYQFSSLRGPPTPLFI